MRLSSLYSFLLCSVYTLLISHIASRALAHTRLNAHKPMTNNMEKLLHLNEEQLHTLTEHLNSRFHHASSSWTSHSQATSSTPFPTSALEQYIQGFMSCRHIPGLSVAVIMNGELAYSKGFGYMNQEGELVNADTLFGIGSTSKAFTSTLAAMAAEKKLISLDGLVKDYLPDFEFLSDKAQPKSIVTVRDLFSHRTGLPRHDYSLNARTWKSRADVVYAAKYLSPATTLRQTWLYNNWMVTVGGYLVGRVSNVTQSDIHSPDQVTDNAWERIVHDQIFTPLNMTRTFATYSRAQNITNRSTPMFYDSSKNQSVNMRYESNFCVDFCGPAGSIVSSANDMAKWVRFQLKNGPALLSNASLETLHAPSMALPFYPPTIPNWFGQLLLGYAYGFNWQIGDYRGYKRVFHNGETIGYQSQVTLIPELNFGVVLLTNGQDIGSFWDAILTSYIMDTVFGFSPVIFQSLTDACNMVEPPTREQQRIFMSRRPHLAQQLQQQTQADLHQLEHARSIHQLFPQLLREEIADAFTSNTLPIDNSAPKNSVNFSDYYGIYTHPAYPTITIKAAPDGPYPLLLTYGLNTSAVGPATAPLLCVDTTPNHVLRSLGIGNDRCIWLDTEFGAVTSNLTVPFVSFYRSDELNGVVTGLTFRYFGDVEYMITYSRILPSDVPSIPGTSTLLPLPGCPYGIDTNSAYRYEQQLNIPLELTEGEQKRAASTAGVTLNTHHAVTSSLSATATSSSNHSLSKSDVLGLVLGSAVSTAFIMAIVSYLIMKRVDQRGKVGL